MQPSARSGRSIWDAARRSITGITLIAVFGLNRRWPLPHSDCKHRLAQHLFCNGGGRISDRPALEFFMLPAVKAPRRRRGIRKTSHPIDRTWSCWRSPLRGLDRHRRDAAHLPRNPGSRRRDHPAGGNGRRADRPAQVFAGLVGGDLLSPLSSAAVDPAPPDHPTAPPSSGWRRFCGQRFAIFHGTATAS